MGDKTGISWTDATWNPVRGCSIVSTGCKNCYAMYVAARFSGPGQPYEGLAERGAHGKPKWTGAVRLVPTALDQPIRWRRPRRIFVNSMSDLFHEALSNQEIAAIFGVMAAAPQHTFQILTKRAERMRDWFSWIAVRAAEQALEPWTECHAVALDLDESGVVHSKSEEAPGRPWPLPNVHLGTSVEDQAAADARIPLLLETPAAVRFVSAEPLLERVNIFGAPALDDTGPFGPGWRQLAVKYQTDYGTGVEHDVAHEAGLDWVIIGGESGYGARPFKIEWARDLIAQCKAAGVAVFMKQLGGGMRLEEDGRIYLVKDRHGAEPSEWPSDINVQEFPEVRR